MVKEALDPSSNSNNTVWLSLTSLSQSYTHLPYGPSFFFEKLGIKFSDEIKLDLLQ
jgi:hypothetical protein